MWDKLYRRRGIDHREVIPQHHQCIYCNVWGSLVLETNLSSFALNLYFIRSTSGMPHCQQSALNPFRWRDHSPRDNCQCLRLSACQFSIPGIWTADRAGALPRIGWKEWDSPLMERHGSWYIPGDCYTPQPLHRLTGHLPGFSSADLTSEGEQGRLPKVPECWRVK